MSNRNGNLIGQTVCVIALVISVSAFILSMAQSAKIKSISEHTNSIQKLTESLYHKVNAIPVPFKPATKEDIENLDFKCGGISFRNADVDAGIRILLSQLVVSSSKTEHAEILKLLEERIENRRLTIDGRDDLLSILKVVLKYTCVCEDTLQQLTRFKRLYIEINNNDSDYMTVLQWRGMLKLYSHEELQNRPAKVNLDLKRLIDRYNSCNDISKSKKLDDVRFYFLYSDCSSTLEDMVVNARAVWNEIKIDDTNAEALNKFGFLIEKYDAGKGRSFSPEEWKKLIWSCYK
jgi:hypothetical protein